jgi:hypothetical protein
MSRQRNFACGPKLAAEDTLDDSFVYKVAGF